MTVLVDFSGAGRAMRVILLGATEMVGQGVLRECVLDKDVERVLVVGRRAAGKQHEKLHEIVLRDFSEFGGLGDAMRGYDTCFFCLGISSVGMKEEDYRKVTYDLTMRVAEALVKVNPQMIFMYVSGAGTDSSEKGRTMWARVKGQTENALLRLPFRGAYMFRPGYIQPAHGVKSRTRWVGTIYAVFGPIYPLLKRVFAKQMMTTECLGKAMIRVAKAGAEKRILEAADINQICEGNTK